MRTCCLVLSVVNSSWMDAGAPQGRGRSNGGTVQEDAGDASNSGDMRSDIGPADNDRPPEGCTTLSLDLLRQLRERGGTLTGLELIVHTDSGEWLKARVQKCDSDFKKVRSNVVDHEWKL